MRIESNEFGSRLPDCKYFPMYLANGVDAMLINVLGSGDCQPDLDFSQPIGALRSTGWYKSNRRVFGQTAIVYGNMLPWLEFGYCPRLNNDYVVPKNLRQFFDPRTATLTTFFDRTDEFTSETLKLKITTFLAHDHVLVQRIEVLAAPASGVSFSFAVYSPANCTELETSKAVFQMDRVQADFDTAWQFLRYSFEYDQFKGQARSWLDVPCQPQIRTNPVFKTVQAYTTTKSLHAGQCVTRYLAVVDNVDNPRFESEIERIYNEYKNSGYSAVLNRHRSLWGSYFETSGIKLPDPAAQFIYDVSRYVLKAVHGPSGFQPVGLLPYIWQGVMFWDACFVVEALLGSGNSREANEVLECVASHLPRARELSNRFGGRGARLEWTVTEEEFTPYPGLVTQFHNNADWVHAAYQTFAYTGDKRILAERIQLMEEFLLFLVDFCLETKGDHVTICKCEGIDESVTNAKTNDTWTAAIMLKSLIEYRRALKILERASRIPEIDKIIAQLETGLQKNVDANNVMQSFQGGQNPHWGSLIFDLFPAHASLSATMQKMMASYDPQMDLYDFRNVVRASNKAFPWTTFWAARIFSRIGDSRAHLLLNNGLKCSNVFGGIPERVYYHGELYIEWFSTAHAAMIWAINGMLANAENDVLRIFSGIDFDSWPDISFAGIYAGSGLKVSAELKNKSLFSLKVTNLEPQKRQVTYIFRDSKKSVVLDPNRETSIV